MAVYIPLARRYRPTKFSEVIGQDITIKILSKAIQNDRLGTAILLEGTRGVGKTTISRILAKVIRCEKGGIDPCLKCKACLEFNSNIDVIEMDAASHTGVEDIRELIESCQYLPTTGKYKVFIIDEVHMLSKSAFNALLKTLEEPPEHVKFIFATTELYKIPETILSRCLRFSLKRIDTQLLTQYLSSVCMKEHIQFEEAAIRHIAKAANGSIRDSLSLLEQAINVSDDVIKEEQIRELLSGISYGDALNLLKFVLNSEAKEAVLATRKAILMGTSANEILSTFMNLLHKMMCIRVGVEYFGDCSLSGEDEISLNVLTKGIPFSRLSTLWQMVEKGATEVHDTENKQIALEMLITRLSYASSLPDLADILKKRTGQPTNGQNAEEELAKRTIEAINNERSIKDEALQMFKGAKVTG